MFARFAFVLQLLALLPAQWRQVRSPLAPPPRALGAVTFDMLRGEVVLFGGVNGPLFGDTWTFDGQQWRQRTGPAPLLRQNAAMTFDLARGVVVMFGGQSGWDSLDDTWEWNGLCWTQANPIQRPPRNAGPALVYDLNRARTVLFSADSQTWEYDGVTWTQVFTAHAPLPRNSPMLCYDVLRQRVVMFGGGVWVYPSNTDTWTYDGLDWVQVPCNSPPPRSRGHLSYDWRRQVCVLVGGNGPYLTPMIDTWEFDGTAWAQVAAPPMLGLSHYSAYDWTRGTMVAISCNEPGATTATWLRGAATNPFGSGCAGSHGEPRLTPGPPILGDILFVDLTNLDPTAGIAALLIGGSQTTWSGGSLPADLQPFGMPGCTLWNSIDVVELMPAAGGSAIWATYIPLDLALMGTEAFLTGVSFDQINAFGAVLSRPVQLTIGD